MIRWPLLAGMVLLASCQLSPPPMPTHYVAGETWQAEGVWHYPQDSLEFSQTGIATVYRDPPQLTTDGEAYDPTALTGAMQTLALPAVATITNLENGLQLTLRINDRGPADPGRIIAVTPHAAALLGFGAENVARVRADILVAESRAAAEALPGGGGQKLEVGLAPVGAVRQVDLGPPGRAPRPVGIAAAPVAVTAVEPPPQRLLENLRQVSPVPGALMIELGTFSRQEFANLQRARLAAVDSRIEPSRNGRATNFLVRLGPYNAINDADAALRQAIAAGAIDARIVVQ